ncbi:MAG: hypothetical protein HY700_11695 [Gemmatimonadetes bacterium]|nr:hypothetical protein [Gemmatimonadota bacterium]
MTFNSWMRVSLLLLQATAVDRLTGQEGPQSSADAERRGGWTLTEVVQRGLARHPLIAGAEARVAAARGARRTAGAIPNPFLTYLVENRPFPGGPAALRDNRETSLFATLPLEPLLRHGATARILLRYSARPSSPRVVAASLPASGWRTHIRAAVGQAKKRLPAAAGGCGNVSPTPARPPSPARR